MERIIKELKLARGVLIQRDQVLLVQDIRPGQGHHFLPGGSVELGEPIKNALVREWQEELGWDVQACAFIGCLEHTWNYNRKQDGALVEVFEMNYLFHVKGSSLVLNQEPVSKESHLKFEWVSLSNLSELNLLPTPLKKLLPELLKSETNGLWESTL